MEELTSDIPNVSEEATKDFDEHGLIRVGAEIKEGDILIGKITPKGETDPSPEEKLLRAIFGDKAGDVKDASFAEAIAEQRRQFDITQANLEPYRVASLPALAQYDALLGLGGTPSYGAPSSQQFGTGWQAGDAGTASQGAGGGLMLNLQELLANQERDPRYYEGKTQEEIEQAIQGEGINIADLPPGSEEFINFNGMGVGPQVGGGTYTSGATRGQGGAGWAGGCWRAWRLN